MEERRAQVPGLNRERYITLITTMFDRFFHLAENKTTVRTELLAGMTTFLTMAYIIVVQPAVLSGAMFNIKTGMDFGSITTATCLSAALATIIMGLYARYPIAQAPGMGENFFFVFTLLPAAGAMIAAQVKAGGHCRHGSTTAVADRLGSRFFIPAYCSCCFRCWACGKN